MPGLDGVSMAMAIRGMLPEVPVLLFSGQASTVDLLHGAEEKGFHFELLQKPISPDVMIRKVAAMLSSLVDSHTEADTCTFPNSSE